jgi:hypothetical protein
MLLSQRRPLTSMFSGFSGPTGTPVLGRTAVVERIIWQVTLTRQAERRLAQNLGTRGSALPV